MLKSLFKDTAIYGMSSIVGRFLNWLLVPLYTHVIAAADGGYGVITNIYSYVALLFVILTYGMETTFFRFMNKEGEDPRLVYRTILTMVGSTSLLFIALVLIFLNPIAAAMGYADHPSYIWTMAVVIALDAFQAIPFAYLRYKKKAMKFAALKLLFIALNISLNLLFFLKFYDPAVGVGYAFYINLACTATVTLFFYKELGECRVQSAECRVQNAESPLVQSAECRVQSATAQPNSALCTLHSALKNTLPLLSYGWPILLLGVAGILNQTADKILFPLLYPHADAEQQLGIYGAAVKIAMILALITQAFRYAYEPLVFAMTKTPKDGKAKGRDNESLRLGMKYFLLFTLLAFLIVMGYIDLLKLIIGADYWEGLRVVPIVMAAEIMMGVYFNLSFWYKLIDKTIYGAFFSGIGCAALILVNVLFVPRYGYMACAWGGVAGYGIAMILSYIVGQRLNPIDYRLPELLLYTLAAALCYVLLTLSSAHLSLIPSLIANTAIIALFAALILRELIAQRRLSRG